MGKDWEEGIDVVKQSVTILGKGNGGVQKGPII